MRTKRHTFVLPSGVRRGGRSREILVLTLGSDLGPKNVWVVKGRRFVAIGKSSTRRRALVKGRRFVAIGKSSTRRRAL